MTTRSIIIAAVLLLLIGFISVKRIRAQGHVDSTAYDVMLSTLLKHNVPEININAAVADTNAIFLDAREHKEYAVSHIPEAIWIGYDDFSLSRVDSIDHSQPIIIYCSVGYRSEVITGKLKKAGFTNVQNLYGGIFEWVNEGHQVVDDQGTETTRVHAYSKKWGVWLNKGEKVYD